mgnify:CR=1 FL=1
MKISVLLPYKENFSTQYAGAVSLFLKDTINLSEYKNNIKVFGSTNYKKDILINNYININTDKFFFQSRSNVYVKNFITYENKIKSDLIEIHNRPNYINKIFTVNKNLVLYFHNDPLEIKGSKSIKDRINLLNKTKKIIFISNWVKKRFLKGINKNNISKKHFEIIQHSTNKKKISLNKKQNLIIFVGRLNKSKGYDIFGKAIINILNNYPNWKSIVIGDELREKITFKHKKLKILGFQKHNTVSSCFIKSDICVVSSRWDEPFGRTALEASSAGCAVIITNKGGLPEASPKALIINNLNVKNLENALIKLIKNTKFKKALQKKILSNFYLTNKFISKKIDKYRNALIKS